MAEDKKSLPKGENVPTGMVEFIYDKPVGNRPKGFVYTCHKSTAEALVAHKIGKITKEIKVWKPKTIVE